MGSTCQYALCWWDGLQLTNNFLPVIDVLPRPAVSWPESLPALVILFGLSQLPPSPRWLANQGRHAESLIVLATLRQLPVDDLDVRKEWMDMRVEAEFQRELEKARLRVLFPKPVSEHAISRDPYPEVEIIEIDSPSVMMQFRLELMKWGDTFRAGCWRRTLVGAGVSSTSYDILMFQNPASSIWEYSYNVECWLNFVTCHSPPWSTSDHS